MRSSDLSLLPTSASASAHTLPVLFYTHTRRRKEKPGVNCKESKKGSWFSAVAAPLGGCGHPHAKLMSVHAPRSYHGRGRPCGQGGSVLRVPTSVLSHSREASLVNHLLGGGAGRERCVSFQESQATPEGDKASCAPSELHSGEQRERSMFGLQPGWT